MKARVSLNPTNSLKKAAEEFAAKDGVSVNQYIAVAWPRRSARAGRRSSLPKGGRTEIPGGQLRFWRGGRSRGAGGRCAEAHPTAYFARVPDIRRGETRPMRRDV